MIRKLLAAAGLSAALLLTAVPANALSVGDTICYSADGTPVINPSNPDDFEDCVTRSGSGSGGTGLQVCTVTVYGFRCTPLVPLQG